MAAPRVDFWYEFASTYSYLAAMRVEAEAAARGLQVVWRPFLLGPIFRAQGWKDTPFNAIEAKGRYMWRDMARLCARRSLAFAPPDPFPQPSLLAARVCATLPQALRPAFTRAVYVAEFGQGRQIGESEVIADILATIGADAGETLALAGSEATKTRLREETATAIAAGVFGAPSFVTADGELFWGDDRLEPALDHAAGRG
jgi:2-hydroxychromene-2-carboxylate isomerase